MRHGKDRQFYAIVYIRAGLGFLQGLRGSKIVRRAGFKRGVIAKRSNVARAVLSLIRPKDMEQVGGSRARGEPRLVSAGRSWKWISPEAMAEGAMHFWGWKVIEDAVVCFCCRAHHGRKSEPDGASSRLDAQQLYRTRRPRALSVPSSVDGREHVRSHKKKRGEEYAVSKPRRNPKRAWHAWQTSSVGPIHGGMTLATPPRPVCGV